jgi:hemerythrin-like domain-containing protein
MPIAITDALRGEHAVLYRLLDHLEREISGASAPQGRALGAFLAAALEAHAHLEDEILFTELEGFLSADAGPLVVMRHEHAAIESGLERLQRAATAEEARAAATTVVDTARSHFAKEEQILFPLAERFLGGGRLAELGRQWAERSAVAIAA